VGHPPKLDEALLHGWALYWAGKKPTQK